MFVTRVALLLVILAACLLVAPPGADAARACGDHGGLRAIKASDTTCATARRLAVAVKRVRGDRDRYARAPRCAGDFCIVVMRWRCRPVRGPKARERCTSGRSSVTWSWPGR